MLDLFSGGFSWMWQGRQVGLGQDRWLVFVYISLCNFFYIGFFWGVLIFYVTLFLFSFPWFSYFVG